MCTVLNSQNVVKRSTMTTLPGGYPMAVTGFERTVTGAAVQSTSSTMKALVYHRPGKRAWEEKPRPTAKDPGDAVLRVPTTTICGTDLHILKGDLPSVADGRILGHEGIWCSRACRSRRLGIP